MDMIYVYNIRIIIIISELGHIIHTYAHVQIGDQPERRSTALGNLEI